MKKILLSSDCNGNFQVLFSKVTQLNQKNKFDLMFLVGNVCPLEASQQFSKIIKGQIKVPIPTYFIDNSTMYKILNLTYPDGRQFAPNFHFLGQSGIKNIQGLNVCYANGLSQKQFSQKIKYKGQFLTNKDVERIKEEAQGKNIDILLTNEWPKQIRVSMTQSTVNFEKNCIKSLNASNLCYHLCPKYHITASGKAYYRMDPFKNKNNSYTHFINIAEIKKELLKDKYLLAIQTIPECLNPPQQVVTKFVNNVFDAKVYGNQPNESRENIQKTQKKMGISFVEEKQIGFKESLKINQKQKQNKYQIVNQSTYVFFDNVPFQARNVDVQQFLQRWGRVIKLQVFKQHKGNCKSGIAKFSKLEQTKSCLVDSGKYSLYQNRIKFKPKSIEQKYRHEDCWFCEKNQKFDQSLLLFRGRYSMVCLDKGPVTEYHLQIIPINHVDTLGKLQPVEIQEIQMITRQIVKHFNQNGYQTIVCERYMKLSEEISHCLIQLLAVAQPKGLIHRFHQINHENRMNFNKFNPDQNRKSQFFIKIEVNEQVFLKQIYPKEKIDFDFVRKLICQLINKPQRINWRNCQRSQSQLNNDKNTMLSLLKQCHLIIQQE